MIRLGLVGIAVFAIKSALASTSASVLVAWMALALAALRGAVSRG